MQVIGSFIALDTIGCVLYLVNIPYGVDISVNDLCKKCGQIALKS